MTRHRDWTSAVEKIEHEGCCRVCGSSQLVDPAHIIPRSRVTKGGEDARNIVPLCRLCHQQQHRGIGLDLLPHLFLDEQAYATELVGIAEAYQRTTGTRLGSVPSQSVELETLRDAAKRAIESYMAGRGQAAALRDLEDAAGLKQQGGS